VAVAIGISLISVFLLLSLGCGSGAPPLGPTPDIEAMLAALVEQRVSEALAGNTPPSSSSGAPSTPKSTPLPTLSPTTDPEPTSEPTPDLLATIEAVVDKRLEEVRPEQAELAADVPGLSASKAEQLVLGSIAHCFLQGGGWAEVYEFSKTNVAATFRGNGEWMVEVSNNGSKFEAFKDQTISIGEFRFIELTGDVIPYDGGARGFIEHC
jgi:hypothetical protein